MSHKHLLRALRNSGHLGSRAAALIEDHSKSLAGMTRALDQARSEKEAAERALRDMSRSKDREIAALRADVQRLTMLDDHR